MGAALDLAEGPGARGRLGEAPRGWEGPAGGVGGCRPGQLGRRWGQGLGGLPGGQEQGSTAHRCQLDLPLRKAAPAASGP